MKASPFVHTEPGKAPVNCRSLVYLTCDRVAVFWIYVLLHVKLCRTHRQLLGHLFSDAFHGHRIGLGMKHFNHFPGQISIERFTAGMLDGSLLRSFVCDLFLFNDDLLNRGFRSK